MSLSIRFNRTGTLVTIPDTALNPADRVIVEDVVCSDAYAPLSGIYAVQKQVRERDGNATLAQARAVYVKPPSVVIDSSMRLQIHSKKGNPAKEYRIRDVTRWPDSDPVYYEILVERER